MHDFLSYSRRDGAELARWLFQHLTDGDPRLEIWWDQDARVARIHPGQNWDAALKTGIAECRTFLYLVTPDSVHENCVAHGELDTAWQYRRPVVPLLGLPGVVPPVKIAGHQQIDFTGNRDRAVRELRHHLVWLSTPDGIVYTLERWLAWLEREVATRPHSAESTRLLSELERTRAEIEAIQAGPREVPIARDLERERLRVSTRPASAGVLRVNAPPASVPEEFTNREVERERLSTFVRSQDKRLFWVVARPGMGKTVLACRVLSDLVAELGPHGVVYLTASTVSGANWPALFDGLAQVVPADARDAARQRLAGGAADAGALTRDLVKALDSSKLVCILLDNFEDALEASSRRIVEADLLAALVALLESPAHSVKVIITTRVTASDLLGKRPGAQQVLHLDQGFGLDHSARLLAALDPDGSLGLQRATPELLAGIQQLTLGNPRALEAFVAILRADLDSSPGDLLKEAQATGKPPEEVAEVLIGEAFRRLDREGQLVMLGLSVFDGPVPAVAVEYLLQPYLVGPNIRSVLSRLVNLKFVQPSNDRRDSAESEVSRRYDLHALDRQIVRSRMPTASVLVVPEEAGQGDIVTTMTSRAANYWRQVRKPAGAWRAREDLEANEAEFELRVRAGEYAAAFEVLEEIAGRLSVWGHDRLVAALHERLHDKLADPALRWKNLLGHGMALRRLGDLDRARLILREAYATVWSDAGGVPASDDRGSLTLAQLGICSADRDERQAATRCYQLAFLIDRDLGRLDQVASMLSNLGIGQAYSGSLLAGVHTQCRGLRISRAQEGERGGARAMANLGVYFGNLGAPEIAIAWFDRSIRIAEANGHADDRIHARYSRASVLIDLGRLEEAIGDLRFALDEGDRLGRARYRIATRERLALAHLLRAEPAAARAIASEVAAVRVPRQDHSLLVVLGIAMALDGDLEGACKALMEAESRCRSALAHDPSLMAAAMDRPAALAGLVASGRPERMAELTDAIELAISFREGRGSLGRLRRLIDHLRPLDSNGRFIPFLDRLGAIMPDRAADLGVACAQGEALCAIGEVDGAVDILDRAMAIDAALAPGQEAQRPPRVDRALATAQASLGEAWRRKGNPGRAAGCYTEAAARFVAAREAGEDSTCEAATAFASAAECKEEVERGSGRADRAECRELLIAHRRSGHTLHPRLRAIFHRGLRELANDLVGADDGPERWIQELSRLGLTFEAIALANLEIEDLHQTNGAADRVRRLGEEAVDLARRHLGESHLEYAQALNNLGVLKSMSGDTGPAREVLNRALAIRRDRVGESHRDYAEVLHNLGFVASIEGDKETAARCYLGALNRFLAIGMVDDPDVLVSLRHAQSVLAQRGEAMRILDDIGS